MTGDSGVPKWFWDLIEDSRPDLERLAGALEGLSRDRLVEYAIHYRAAADDVRDTWDGPFVDDIPFSEDDTEDLCNWVVGQGRTLWRHALSLKPNLEPIVRLYWTAKEGKGPPDASWTTTVSNPAYQGYQAPEFIAYAVFRARFGEELDDVIEETDNA